MKKNITIALISIALVISLLVGRCNNQKAAADTRRFQDLIKTQNTEIVRSHTEVLTSQKAIKDLSNQIFEKDKKIKEVSALVQTTTKTTVPNIPLVYHDTFKFTDTVLITKNNRDSFIRVPVKASYENKDVKVSVTVKKEGVTLDSLTLTDTTSIRIVKRRKGLFGSEYVIETVRTSPYVKITKQSSYVFKPKTNLWNKVIKPAGAFILGGILATKL